MPVKELKPSLRSFYTRDLMNERKRALEDLLDRHAQSRAKISSQCDTLISKKLVEDMIKELK